MNDRTESITRNLELYKALLAAKVRAARRREEQHRAASRRATAAAYSYAYADLADIDRAGDARPRQRTA